MRDVRRHANTLRLRHMASLDLDEFQATNSVILHKLAIAFVFLMAICIQMCTRAEGAEKEKIRNLASGKYVNKQRGNLFKSR